MDVILLEKIQNLGNLGDQVTVKPGYGRNFLIPEGKAVPATKDNVARFEAERAELEKAEATALAEAQARAEKLNDTSITIQQKAGSEGKLFGSVTNHDIAEAVTAEGVELQKSEVQLPEGPFRSTGEFEVAVQLHADVSATIKLTIEAEE